MHRIYKPLSQAWLLLTLSSPSLLLWSIYYERHRTSSLARQFGGNKDYCIMNHSKGSTCHCMPWNTYRGFHHSFIVPPWLLCLPILWYNAMGFPDALEQGRLLKNLHGKLPITKHLCWAVCGTGGVMLSFCFERSHCVLIPITVIFTMAFTVFVWRCYVFQNLCCSNKWLFF